MPEQNGWQPATWIPVGGNDEFGDLARQFNNMVASLKEQQHRLLQSERLAGVGRLAAGVAHEINNPLGVILGYTRLLRKKAVGPLGDDLAIVEEEVLRCQEIVEGLLDFSRPVVVGSQRVDLRALCDDVVARLAEAAPTPSTTWCPSIWVAPTPGRMWLPPAPPATIAKADARWKNPR